MPTPKSLQKLLIISIITLESAKGYRLIDNVGLTDEGWSRIRTLLADERLVIIIPLSF